MQHYKNKTSGILKEIIDGITIYEEWRVAPVFDELYHVSTFGRLWSIRKKRIMAQSLNGKGYPTAVFTDKDGNPKTRTTHRIVALTFIGPSNGLHIDHLNMIKTDNRPENLEYVTSRENKQRAVLSKNPELPIGVVETRNGKYASGINIGKRKIHFGTFPTPEQAHEIYKRATVDMSKVEEFAVHRDPKYGQNILYRKNGRFLVQINKKYVGGTFFSEESAIAFRDKYKEEQKKLKENSIIAQ